MIALKIVEKYVFISEIDRRVREKSERQTIYETFVETKSRKEKT